MGPTTTDAVIGRLVDGRYEITRRIARGGMATVYHAVDRRLDREVAVKIMHAHLAESDDFVARFRREARAAARLSHPNVVGVYDQGLWHESFYLTMEYVEGEDLRARLRREGTLSLGEALAITENVCEALAAAHRRDLVHRDIKPENVMIDTEGVVKVADFGLARAISDATAITTGTVLGTVAYLAPELVTRVTAATPAVDVYATGILLYEMITGTQPFTGDLPINVAMQHVNADVPAASDEVGGLPTELDELIAALTARDPAERLPDGGAALALVRRARDTLDDATLAMRAIPPTDETQGTPSGNHTAPLSRKVSSGTVALPAAGIEPDQTESARAAGRRRGRGRVVSTVLLVLLVAVGAIAGWYFLAGPGAFITMPAAVGLPSGQAVQLLDEAGLDPQVTQRHDDVVPADEVIETVPAPGADARRGGRVSVVVSQGVLMLAMPDLMAGTAEEAVASLKTEGFPDPEIAESYHESIPAGGLISALVDGVQVAPGTEYDHRTVVALDVSLGREPVEVPDVIGRSQADAEAALIEAGLVAQYGEPEYSETVAEGSVIRQTPAAPDPESEENFRLYRGDTVTLVLSLGMPYVEVPDLFGAASADAERAVRDAGLVPDPTYYWEGVLDTVRFQNPGAGTMVRKGSTVAYTVL
ncbi:MAG TPA: Stk1 family PASTA domain-containing Ser/Thr kinase [Actinomycetaceae bacterium]|nr:Stk1 family PASTA domain-containing Ser/Thr kinase [Actinomycetaceae bacterium]